MGGAFSRGMADHPEIPTFDLDIMDFVQLSHADMMQLGALYTAVDIAPTVVTQRPLTLNPIGRQSSTPVARIPHNAPPILPGERKYQKRQLSQYGRQQRKRLHITASDVSTSAVHSGFYGPPFEEEAKVAKMTSVTITPNIGIMIKVATLFQRNATATYSIQLNGDPNGGPQSQRPDRALTPRGTKISSDKSLRLEPNTNHQSLSDAVLLAKQASRLNHQNPTIVKSEK